MHVLFLFMAFQCVREAWFQPCIYTDTDYVCKEIPEDYPPGLTSVIFFMSGIGEISLSIFNSTTLSSVNSLIMAGQGITTIKTQSFDKFQNLKTLNLHKNDLTQVSSDWFNHQVPLETLRLSNNKITSLDQDSFDALSNLLLLNLSQNQIHTITTSSFLSLGKLRQLDLSNNSLTDLSVDVFLPLNGTKIRLDGNPWNCSCSMMDFAKYLRGLRNASLLENEMQVCCSSPPELKGVPVWQVPECKTLTTPPPGTNTASLTTVSLIAVNLTTVSLTAVNLTTVSLTSANLTTEIVPAVITTKPLTIGHTTLIILIVVLCALVLVICVLSVLYHRKRERKHLQAVKPCPDIPASETTKGNREQKHKMKSEFANKTKVATTDILMRTNQMVAGSEQISQIYHIYSSGTYENRDPIKRVRSAGPVLCRMDMFAELTETEVENEVRNDEYYKGWMTTERLKERGNSEGMEKLEDGKNMDEEKARELSNTSGNTLETFTEAEDDEMDECVKAGPSVDKDIPQLELENLSDHMNVAGSSQDILQAKPITSQSEETPENLPYLSIGADPESQISVVDPDTPERTSGHLRPIRRVLTWPPTAVQWKKQWAQNQQVLNVFPKLIFVTGCRHEVRQFHPSVSPISQQFNALEFLPEIMTPEDNVQVNIEEDTYRSCTPKVLHFSPKECFANANISQREGCRVVRNEETWRFESTIDLSSKNSPVDESDISSELFSIFNPPFYSSRSKPAVGEEIVNKDNIQEMQSVKKKTHRVASELQKPSRRAAKSIQRTHRNRQQGQVWTSSDSRAPPSGGSPKDDSLLLGNEYTFIDLLHEVVENNGRWTRDRWRQTQKNKHKLKQSR